MDEIICYTGRLPANARQSITFMDLLLDENWASGQILCPIEAFQKTGNMNCKLTAKLNYEFLLRAVQEYPFTAVGISGPSNPPPLHMPDSVVLPDASMTQEDPWHGYRTDCYIIGKYQKELLSSGYFDLAVASLLQDASRLPDPEEAARLLEQMISHSPAYFEIDDDTRPILVYRGQDICYNTLNLFADEFANALRSCRQRTEVFDAGQEGGQALTQFIGCRFKAIIGIQTYAFSIMMQDKKTNLHDLIIGPKYNMILDHPAWMKDHIGSGPKDYYLLIHDRNYLAFAKRYYKKAKNSFYFPPGGVYPSCRRPEKRYDITFVGSYRNYRERLSLLASYDRPYRFLAARFLHIMRRNPDVPAELAFQKTLDFYDIRLDDAGFLDLFYEMRQACFCIMLYYREKVILTLLQAGIEVHVYSDSWKNAPFAGHPCLICHPALSAEKSLEIMAQSRISFNIMSWHKDGLTERIFNAMLCRSVVLSDRSSALEEIFTDGQEIILFSLKRLDALPSLVKGLLADNRKLQEIADRGYHKACRNHSWASRARQFLELIQEDT